MVFEVINNIVDPFVKLTQWNWLSEINIWSILVKLALATLFGGVIGIERTAKKHAAGLRTYMMVCIGSAMAMMINEYLITSYGTGDSARIGAQVISGIGFLGAGTIIITSRSRIKGLTTAAALWACATMGLSIGASYYTLATIGFVFIYVILTLLPFLENFINKHTSNFEIHIEFESRSDLKFFIKYIRDKNMKIKSIERNLAYESSGLSVYTIYIAGEKEFRFDDHSNIIEEIKNLDYVNYVEEIN